MRMPLEEFGRSLMRVRANDHVGTHLIACIFDTSAFGSAADIDRRSALIVFDAGTQFSGAWL